MLHYSQRHHKKKNRRAIFSAGSLSNQTPLPLEVTFDSSCIQPPIFTLPEAELGEIRLSTPISRSISSEVDVQ
jgi:hypothetical protein